MPRPLRPDAPGTVHHVTARGVDQRMIFMDDHDRRLFMRTLAAVAERWRWLRLAHCLMGNHYHLLIGTPVAGLAAGMQRLNGYYAQAFNHRHRRSGHLFQGRYGSRLVQTDAHLLATARYIEMNPVTAGICTVPTDWPWAGSEQALDVLLSDYQR
jgi:putative transposase